ncbi:MAG: hypothetical protein FWC60_10450, partial [Firmicutes bacterium]|nr:hypothetical protein [Bacillota bacterium]
TPCTITIGGLHDITTNGIENTDIAPKITEMTGITVQLVTIDSTKLTTMAASGDLPDILYIGDTTGQLTQSLISSGSLVQIDDLLQSNGQNILKRAQVGIDNLKKQTGGKTYVIPTGITPLNTTDPSYNGSNGFFTRFDLYQGIGSPKVTGVDSFLSMLQQMQQANPTAPSGNKTYALSAWTDWQLWPYYYIFPNQMGYEGLEVNQYVNRYTGDWTSSFLDPQSIFWQNVEFYFKANQLGIFDPDGLTQGWAQLGTKIANGEVFTCCAGNWSVPDKKVCGDTAGLFMIPGSFPVGWNVFTPELAIGWGFNDCRAITSACKNPTRAMDLLNFFDSDEGARLINDGVQGVDWDYVDGVPQPIGSHLECLLNTGSSTYNADNGIGCLSFMSSGNWTCADGYSNSLTTTTAYYNLVMQQDKAAQNFVAAYNNGDASISYPGKVYDLWGKQGIMQNNNDFPWPTFQGYLTPSAELTKAEANAETYITGELGNLILAKDQAAFNDAQARIIDALKAQGLEEAEKEVLKDWQDLKAQLQPQVTKSVTPLPSGFDISGMNPAQ